MRKVLEWMKRMGLQWTCPNQRSLSVDTAEEEERARLGSKTVARQQESSLWNWQLEKVDLELGECGEV